MNNTYQNSLVKTWLNHIAEEIRYHDRRLWEVSQGEAPELASRLEVREFIYPEADDIHFSSSNIILDVGSGPLPKFGTLIGKVPLKYKAFDPLAYEYKKLFNKYKIIPPCEVNFALLEALSSFIQMNSADYVICHNALDHSIDALQGLIECIKVTKVGGEVLLSHFESEGAYENYEGLHKWNIGIDHDEVVISSLEEDYNITKLLNDYCNINAKKIYDKSHNRERIHIRIKKKASFDKYLSVHDSKNYISTLTAVLAQKLALCDGIYSASGEKYIPMDENYIIFGTGRLGKAVLSWFGDKKGKIAYVMDNNVKLKGTHWYGFEVKTPSDFKTKDGKIIIASERYAHEMKSQLLRIGLLYKKDFLTFNDFIKDVKSV